MRQACPGHEYALVSTPCSYASRSKCMTSGISKLDLALIQLDRSIDLYLQGTTQEMVCAITLAGAAEEILGRLVENGGGTAAFHDTIRLLCGMQEAAWPESKADPKAYVTIRTKARNDLKHITDGAPFTANLERETVSIIRRAIANHRKLGCGFVERYRAFESELVRRGHNTAP